MNYLFFHCLTVIISQHVLYKCFSFCGCFSPSSILDLSTSCANNGWTFERVSGFELREHEKRLLQAPTSQDCMQACVWEQKFQCRSINYESKTGECWLSDMNRHTVNINTEIRSQKYGPSSGNIDYYEFNCVQGKESKIFAFIT